MRKVAEIGHESLECVDVRGCVNFNDFNSFITSWPSPSPSTTPSSSPNKRRLRDGCDLRVRYGNLQTGKVRDVVGGRGGWRVDVLRG